jgi:CheY-like chemotaxis protein
MSLMNQKKILVVDDSPVIRKVLSMKLQPGGLETVSGFRSA